MNTKENPEDYVSRRISMTNRDEVERWSLGPNFLWEPEDTWNSNTKTQTINPEYSELKAFSHVNQIVVQTDLLLVLENHTSTWSNMVRIIALMMLFVKNVRPKIMQIKVIIPDEGTTRLVTTTMIRESRISLVKLV